jgi:Tfp pilus assembly protein PilN
MIRINLLGQAKPKASRRPVDTGAAVPALFIGAGLLFGCVVLGYLYYSWQRQLNDENARIKQLQAQKTDLEQIKQQVEAFEKQKQVLQQRVSTIEQLQRDRTGGQELLDQIASTVARTENLWLTSMIRKGNNLSIEGSSASINAVANFITALKRSGYFQKVEIKESKQDDKNVAIQTFNFQLSAEISPPPPAAPSPRPQVKAVSAPATPAPAAAAPAKPPAAVPAKPAAAAPAKPAPASPTKPPAAAPKKPAPAPAAKPAAAPGTKKG